MVNKFKLALKLFNDKRLTTVTGAWVYYFISSVIPLAFLLITAFKLLGISIAGEFVARLPEEYKIAGETIATTAENASKSVTVFFVISVVFSCTALLNQMSKDGDFIFGETAKHKRGLFRRLWAVVALISLFAVFLGSALLFAFGEMVFGGVKITGSIKLLLTIAVFCIIIVSSYSTIILLQRFISPIRLKLSCVATGAFCSLIIIVLGTIGLTVYLRFIKPYNAFYGSLTAILIFLLWAYIVMLGLVVGGIVNSQVQEKYMSAKKEKKHARNKEFNQDIQGRSKGGRQSFVVR